MDQYVYEIRHHILRALPVKDYHTVQDWDGTPYLDVTPESRERYWLAGVRISDVLHRAARGFQ